MSTPLSDYYCYESVLEFCIKQLTKFAALTYGNFIITGGTSKVN